jgi:hypothetical protein
VCVVLALSGRFVVKILTAGVDSGLQTDLQHTSPNNVTAKFLCTSLHCATEINRCHLQPSVLRSSNSYPRPIYRSVYPCIPLLPKASSRIFPEAEVWPCLSCLANNHNVNPETLILRRKSITHFPGKHTQKSSVTKAGSRGSARGGHSWFLTPHLCWTLFID